MRPPRAAAAAVAIAALAGMSAAPAQGATTYTIRGTKVLVGVEEAFLASCNSAYVSSPLNGISSVVIDIGSRVNQTATATWSGNTTLQEKTGGNLTVQFYNSACRGTGRATQSTTPGSWSLAVPGDAKWLIVSSSFIVDVRFTI